jgi:hypothetical protein
MHPQIVKKATGVGMCVLIVLYVAIVLPIVAIPRNPWPTPLPAAAQELHSSTATKRRVWVCHAANGVHAHRDLG